MNKKYMFPSVCGVRCYYKHCFAQSAILEGDTKIFSAKTKNKIIFCNIVFLRGVEYFFCGLFALLCTVFNITKQIQKTEKSKKMQKNTQRTEKNVKKLQIFIKNHKNAIKIFLLTLVTVFGICLFVFGCNMALFYISKAITDGAFLCFVFACFKIAFFCILLLALRMFPLVVEFLRFNGACNIDSDVAKRYTYYNPLNFLNFVFFSFVLSEFVITYINASLSFFGAIILDFVAFLLCTSVSYEILHIILISKNKYLKSLSILSCIVCIKPKITHIISAQSAQMEVTLLANTKGRSFMNQNSTTKSYSAMYSLLKVKFASAGIDIADLDWIIATVLKKSRTEIKLCTSVLEEDCATIFKLAQRRLKHEPLSSIFGFVDFYGFKMEVNKKVLSPRMDTEVLVENVIKVAKTQKFPKILEIGTGSGAISIALAKLCNCEIVATDISCEALDIAKKNAQKNEANITFVLSNLFKNLKKRKKYDIIVSNPPYIKSADIKNLDIEVRKYDPTLALDGGEDGLNFFKDIASMSKSYLVKGGMLFFEIGLGQTSAVVQILKKEGFVDIGSAKDYGKIDRVVYGKFIG